jgi:hypothetical protein
MKSETIKDVSSCASTDDEDGWVYVRPEDANVHMTLWQGCKKHSRKLIKYYKRAKTLYTIYRVVRFLVHMYILYNTLAPFKLV